MRSSERLTSSFAMAITVACVVHVVNPRAPVYHPLARTWIWDTVPGAPLMAWYGRSLWAVGAGLLVLVVMLPLSGRIDGRTPPTWLTPTLAAVTLVAMAVALGNTVAHEYATWIRR